jgi:hypothetical protein
MAHYGPKFTYRLPCEERVSAEGYWDEKRKAYVNVDLATVSVIDGIS